LVAYCYVWRQAFFSILDIGIAKSEHERFWGLLEVSAFKKEKSKSKEKEIRSKSPGIIREPSALRR
jgi:hypothetical protein